VLTTRYFISDIVLDGIIHFVSNEGNLGVLDFDRSVYRLQYELSHGKTKFFSPDYSSENSVNNRIPDFRNTLYWDPDLSTTKNGKTNVSFFSSDEPSAYMIIVEGFTSDGRHGSSSIPLVIMANP
jgi:hypothetical protein